eukprot:10545137-Alexandrium_andersonii.AAC.1
MRRERFCRLAVRRPIFGGFREIDWSPTRTKVKKLELHERRTLARVQACGMWTAEKKKQIGIRQSATCCCWCEEAEESLER